MTRNTSSKITLPAILLWGLLSSLPLAAAHRPEISPEQFKAQVQEITKRVPEFVRLAHIAQRHGLKVWLFGGSAASFAHYIKEDMLFNQGVDEFYPQAFAENSLGERDLLDIFRPSQDIDLVVDGDLTNLQAFEREVMMKLPDFLGNKKTWEVRPLRDDYKDKVALLGNPNFLNQHTDSHSVGLISLSLSSKQEVIKDLLDWESDTPRFLQDVLSGQLHYYYNPLHQTTSRYLQSLNPEIFSVIRYFTKLSQFELKMGAKDRENLRRVVDSFAPQEMQRGHYITMWLNRNMPKLFLHSRNVEYSMNKLKAIGLQQKLVQLGDINAPGSPAWWLNKSPLPSFPVGSGDGRTAHELGIKSITHDTKDFSTWMIILRSRKGEANLFESRPDIPGESASLGRGFYAVINSSQGLHKNGFSISFRVDPNAHEGSDFSLEQQVWRGEPLNWVRVHNRSILRVIPESLDVGGLQDYLSFLLGHRFQGGNNKGILVKLHIRMARKFRSPGDIPEQEVQAGLQLLKKHRSLYLWMKWFALEISQYYTPSFEDIIRSTSLWSRSEMRSIATNGFHGQSDSNYQKVLRRLIVRMPKKDLWLIAEHVLSRPEWAEHPKLLTLLIKRMPSKERYFHRFPPLFPSYQARGGRYLASRVLSQPHWAGKHPKLIAMLIKKTSRSQVNYIGHILLHPAWAPYPELLIMLLEKIFLYRHLTLGERINPVTYEEGNLLELIRTADFLLSLDHWKNHPRLIELTGQEVNRKTLKRFIKKTWDDC